MVLRKTSQGELNPIARGSDRWNERRQRWDRGFDAGHFCRQDRYLSQIIELPLMSLQELKARYPEIGSKLGENDLWTVKAEQALINSFWTGSKNDG